MSAHVMRNSAAGNHDWGLFFAGLVVLLCGVAVMFWPGFTLEIIAVATGIALIVAGVFSFIKWSRIHEYVDGSGWIIANGICEVILGALCLFAPMFAAGVLTFVIGCGVIVYGVFATVSSINFRKISDAWWLMLLNGIVSIICGFFFMFSPAFLAIFLGVFLIMQGVTMSIYGIFPTNDNNY